MRNKLSKRLRDNGVDFYLLIPLVLFIVLVPATVPLLGIDNVPFLKEYLMVFLLGAGFYPITECLFSEWKDRGWLFSKMIGLSITGTLLGAGSVFWNLEVTGVLALVVAAILILLCQVLGLFVRDSRSRSVPLIVWEEVLFFSVFLLWTYLAGFHPEAYDSEKYVQFGLFHAMERSGSLNVWDIWYQGSSLPVSAAGLWFGALLTRMCFTEAGVGFNLYHALLAAFTFTLPFSICYTLVSDKMRLRGEVSRMRRDAIWPALAGFLAGIFSCFAGNLHYIWYGLLGSLTGHSDYWFPDSTRFIGYSSAACDQTITEFPAYDFVIGDLSENVCALWITFFLIGVGYNLLSKDQESLRKRKFDFQRAAFWNPSVFGFGIALGILVSMHPVVAPVYGLLFLGLNYSGCKTLLSKEREKRKPLDGFLIYGVRLLMMLGACILTALPYLLSTNRTDISMAAVSVRSAIGELALLWLFPVLTFGIVAAAILLRWKHMGIKGRGRRDRFFTEILTPDHFLLLTGALMCLCILVPEFVYVRDIYEKGYPRAYTMKYSAWEASLLSSVVLGYGIIRLLSWKKEPVLKLFGALAAGLVLLSAGYSGNAISSWCGQITDLNAYHGLDVTAYLESVYPQEAQAIRWLDENTDSQVCLLEADASSYSYACRFSALTGHAIPLGWHAHEWAQDHSIEEINLREFDVETMYTSSDPDTVRDLLDYYQVSYIVLGPSEQEKFGKKLQKELLTSLAQTCYEDTAVTILRYDPE